MRNYFYNDEVTLDCQDCGKPLRVLTDSEIKEVAANPYNFIFYCNECSHHQRNRSVF